MRNRDIAGQLLELRNAICDGTVIPPWRVARRPWPTYYCAWQASSDNHQPTTSTINGHLMLELEVEIMGQRIEDKAAALRKLDALLKRRVDVQRRRARQMEAIAKLDARLAREIQQLMDAAEFASAKEDK